MNELNATNRSVYISDNLAFLKALNTGTVDLVCIDPPFAKNETFGRKNRRAPDPLKPPLTEAERQTELDLMARWGIRTPEDADRAGINWPETAYKDFWSWEKDVHEEWLRDIENNHPAIASLIEATRQVHSDSTAAYLCYMAVRLFEIRRVLKDTGSLYLHCDHTAGAYLRQLLDGIFGKDCFRNEIAWRRTHSKNFVEQDFGRNHDTILRYTKNRIRSYFDKETARKPYDRSSGVPPGYTWSSQHGDYIARAPVHAPGSRTGDSGRPATFRGITYQPPINRHWTVPGGRLPNESVTEGWARADNDGLMYIAPNGKYPTSIRLLSTMPGIAVDDFWADITLPTALEKTGYPTQKPIALAERIIKASCPEDGVVLDCFAGCAYVAVAAERLGRQWIACDINPRAWTVFKRQFNKPQLALLECREPTEGQTVMPGSTDAVVTVHGPNELPERTSPTDEARVPEFRVPERKFKVPASDIPEREMLEMLLELSEWKAWCCGFANRMPNGEIIRTTRNFHLDHLNPRSLEGTSHQITNRAPLCPYHNTSKGNRRLHLAEYRRIIADADEMLVESAADLINLDEAVHRVQEIYFAWRVRNAPQIPSGLDD